MLLRCRIFLYGKIPHESLRYTLPAWLSRKTRLHDGRPYPRIIRDIPRAQAEDSTIAKNAIAAAAVHEIRLDKLTRRMSLKKMGRDKRPQLLYVHGSVTRLGDGETNRRRKKEHRRNRSSLWKRKEAAPLFVQENTRGFRLTISAPTHGKVVVPSRGDPGRLFLLLIS